MVQGSDTRKIISEGIAGKANVLLIKLYAKERHGKQQMGSMGLEAVLMHLFKPYFFFELQLYS
jgi:hypothetical protein